MPIPQNAETIWNYLTGQGLIDNAAAGILGNIEQESGGDPSAGVWPFNYGLIQWTPANDYFSSAPSLQQQLPAIISYIKANGSISAINQAATSPAAAALYFSDTYERPDAAVANNANREASASAVLAAAKSGNWQTGTAAAAAASSSGSSGGGTGGLISWPSEITSFFSDASGFVDKAMWLASPASWVRIGAFLAGITLLMFAIYALVRAGEGQPFVKAPSVVPVPV